LAARGRAQQPGKMRRIGVLGTEISKWVPLIQAAKIVGN
jgi:hypothetical protein